MTTPSTSTEAARPSGRRRALAALAGGSLAWVVTGCSPPAPAFNAIDITGANYAHDFALADHNGVRRTLADFKGKVVAVFFGFTQCPDACPTAMARMVEVVKLLGPEAARLQVVFITVDPERDSAEVLRAYVPSFDPTFIGLRGDVAATAETAKHFKAFYQKAAGKTAESYTVDHSTFTFLFDAGGRIRLLVKHDLPADKLAADVRALLKSS